MGLVEKTLVSLTILFVCYALQDEVDLTQERSKIYIRGVFCNSSEKFYYKNFTCFAKSLNRTFSGINLIATTKYPLYNITVRKSRRWLPKSKFVTSLDLRDTVLQIRKHLQRSSPHSPHKTLRYFRDHGKWPSNDKVFHRSLQRFAPWVEDSLSDYGELKFLVSHGKVDSNNFSTECHCQEPSHKVQQVCWHNSIRRLQIHTQHNCTRRTRGNHDNLQHVQFVEQEQLRLKLDATSTETTSIFISLKFQAFFVKVFIILKFHVATVVDISFLPVCLKAKERDDLHNYCN